MALPPGDCEEVMLLAHFPYYPAYPNLTLLLLFVIIIFTKGHRPNCSPMCLQPLQITKIEEKKCGYKIMIFFGYPSVDG